MASRHRRFTAFGVTVLFSISILGGCAGLPVEPEVREETQGLYDGEAQVLYDAKEKAKTSKEAMEYAKQALQVGDTDRALYQFVTAYELDPERYEALYHVGRIQSSKNNLERAMLAFNMALRIEPEHGDTLTELGLVELRLRRYEQAGEHIKQGLENGNESWRAFNGLAVLSDLNRDFESAEQYYLKALQLNPGSPRVWNNRGYSRYLAGDWNLAQRYIKKALDYDSGYRKAWLNLGLIQVREGSYENAVSTFERVMNKAGAYERVGSLALVQGKYDIAERFLYRAIDASPTYYEAAYEKIRKLEMLRGAGQLHDAMDEPDATQPDPAVSRMNLRIPH